MTDGVAGLWGTLFPAVTLRRVLAWGTVLVACTVVAWISPMSPIALARADAALGEGRVGDAVALYDQIAAANPSAVVRGRALHRAAVLYDAELSDGMTAKTRLQRLARGKGAERALRAWAWEELASRSWERQGRAGDAARLYDKAVRMAPRDVDAPRRLARAAEAHAAAGQTGKAFRHWERLRVEYAGSSVQADLGEAEFRLQLGDPAGALTLYERAMAGEGTERQRRLARVGADAALQGLAQAEGGALAGIDPSEVLDVDTERRRRYGQRRRGR